MRALFIQHDPGARPGLVGDRLRERGYELETVTIADGFDDATFTDPFPAAKDHDLIVPLGAIWSLYDDATVGTWIHRELDLLRAADRAGVPVLGICFGGQSLAAAHGGVVEPASAPEIGWTTIETDDADLIPAGPWMQWHNDRFSVPPGATELARGPRGPQAFRLRRNLGVQFHPEVDEARVRSWIELGGQAAQAALSAVGSSPAEVLDDCRRYAEVARANAYHLVDRFLAEVAGRG